MTQRGPIASWPGEDSIFAWRGGNVPEGKRWKKMAAAAAPRVLIFHSCANFACILLKIFGLFCAIGGIFANFA